MCRGIWSLSLILGQIVRCVVSDVITLHVVWAKCQVWVCLRVGRIWSMVREVDTHVGNMLDGLSPIEHESRQTCRERSRLGEGGG
jgi:hypothetical protein